MNLLLLAPDIQKALLTLLRRLRGRDPIRENQVRPIAAESDWQVQRVMWGDPVAGTISTVAICVYTLVQRVMWGDPVADQFGVE